MAKRPSESSPIRPPHAKEGRGVRPSSAYGGLIGHDLGGHSAMILTDFEDKPATDLPLEFRGSFFASVWVCPCFSSLSMAWHASGKSYYYESERALGGW